MSKTRRPKLSARARNHAKSERKRLTSLTLLLALLVFCILLAAIGLAVLGVFILQWAGVIASLDEEVDLSIVVAFMSAISLILAWVLVFFSIRIPLRPIHSLISSMNRLAMGDFSVRMEGKGMLANHPAIRDLCDGFNKLAEELENTEMLRGDFINNFSHEFKTPIVSIAGFAKLLKRNGLSDGQRMSYLNSIEEESLRLSYMATNVLNLTKVENQTILTDVTSFNVSEQVRSAVLLLEAKWSEKDIDLRLDFDEHMLEGNEELLKQVWINLVDNAIKFSPPCGAVLLDVQDGGETVTVTVSNTGPEIPEEKRERIFSKFYQTDESHATEGNGIGLAVVKRVVDLHGGRVTVKSENGMTTFTVELPKQPL
ncbi:MAG: HAMP domain-containing histidine kinase [Clostridia bacterium]|nr:HAMP domain-containing histidine kinase [Clostridia bacterium]